MTNKEFTENIIKALDIPTLYVMGGIGYKLDAKGKQRTQNNQWNTTPSRKNYINNASNDTRAFDCVGIIKNILWGGFKTEEDIKKGTYCGAKYDNKTDFSADGMIKNGAINQTTDFNKQIPTGALLWKSGHVGVYLGKTARYTKDGKARHTVLECSPSFANKVQITFLQNLNEFYGNSRKWTKWALLKGVEYDFNYNLDGTETPTQAPEQPQEQNYIIYTVKGGDTLTKIAGKYGTTVDNILQLNPQITDKNKIYKGQKIKIPTA